MYSTLVVALDLEPDGDRALPVVRALSELADVSIELLSVTPRREELEVDAFELSRRATANGWPAHSYSVLRSDDPAGSIVDHVRGRSDVLLVMATTARRPAVGHLLGSVTERVLHLVDQPVLLIGPHVPPTVSLTRPTLIACVDPKDDPSAVVSTVTSWKQSFASGEPKIVDVLPRTDDGSIVGVVESAHVHRVAPRPDRSWSLRGLGGPSRPPSSAPARSVRSRGATPGLRRRQHAVDRRALALAQRDPSARASFAAPRLGGPHPHRPLRQPRRVAVRCAASAGRP